MKPIKMNNNENLPKDHLLPFGTRNEEYNQLDEEFFKLLCDYDDIARVEETKFLIEGWKNSTKHINP